MATDARLRRYRHILNPAPHYPVWSIRAIGILVLLVILLTTILVFTVGHSSFLKKLEVTLAICTAFEFALLALGLFFGARVKRRDAPQGPVRPGLSHNVDDHAEAVHILPDVVPVDAVDHPAGCLLAVLGTILLAVLAPLITYCTVEAGALVISSLLLAITWVLYRGLRMVFARSRQCRGKLWPSLGWAAFHTLLHSGWLLGVLLLCQWAVAK